MIKLVINNIRNSFIAYRNIYSMLLVSQFTGIVILLLVYGIITNYNIKLQEDAIGNSYIYANFSEEVPAEKIKEFLPEMLAGMEDRLKECYLDFGTEGQELFISCLEGYKDGKYFFSENSYNEERLVAGRYPTEEELAEGKPVAFAHGSKEKNDEPTYGVGDIYSVCGIEYEIVGVIDGIYSVDEITVPINSCTDDMKINVLAVFFEKFPTVSDYENFCNTVKANCGEDVHISDLKIVSLDDAVRYNSIIFLAFMIGGIAAFDTILVYRYILKKRQRQMAIFSLTGAVKWQRAAICNIEIILVTVITTVIGVLLFEFVLKKPIYIAYRPSMEMYNIKIYLYLAISYVLTIIIATSVMVAIGTKKRVLDIRRR